jgi:hypothetical protein
MTTFVPYKLLHTFRDSLKFLQSNFGFNGTETKTTVCEYVLYTCEKEEHKPHMSAVPCIGQILYF